jgi:hypothetical protein
MTEVKPWNNTDAEMAALEISTSSSIPGTREARVRSQDGPRAFLLRVAA